MALPSAFRWMPGMLTLAGWRILSPQSRGYAFKSSPEPDLTDPGTKGCLLALVREASGDPLITASASVEADYIDGGPEREETVTWGLASPQPMREALRRVEEASEGEALMAALRALEVPHV